MDKRKNMLAELKRLYPEAKAELDFSNPYETLIATILSAQCTDKKVNLATPALFRDFPDAAAMAQATPEDIEPYIRSLGLYHNKAKNIVAACRAIVAQHDGQVPGERAALEALPGVGRKTASVVLSNAFGEPAIAVDTHVFRVSNRLGLAHAKDVVRTEQQLMQAIPKRDWSDAHHWIIYHGRRVCHSQRPDCAHCTLRELCEYAKREQKEVV